MNDPAVLTLLLDAFLLLALLGFTAQGWGQGFCHVAGSVLGFVAGAVTGLRYVPDLVARVAAGLDHVALFLVVVGLVVLAAFVGQGIGAGLMRWLRHVLLPSRTAPGPVDRLLGAVATTLMAGFLVWLGVGLLRVAATGPVGTLIDASRVIRALDAASPVPRDRVLSDASLLFAGLDFPRVFEGNGPEPVAPAEPADPAVARNAAVARAGRSVLRIDATATRCRRMQEGSGFVVAPGLVVTNAHVVAGAEGVAVRSDAVRSRATVVAFDPSRDIALLSADTTGLRPLPVDATPLRAGDEAVVAGYPRGGPYRTEPARVRGSLTARGRDIYDDQRAARRIYALRSTIQPGNSGGPLLTPEGTVAGVIFARSVDDLGTAYALRPEELQPVLDGARSRTPVAVGGCVNG